MFLIEYHYNHKSTSLTCIGDARTMTITARAPKWSVNDFTTFLPCAAFTTEPSSHLDSFQRGDVLHLDDDVQFADPDIEGRALACWCWNRQSVSLSVRVKNAKDAKAGQKYSTERQLDVTSTWKVKEEHQDTTTLCDFFHSSILKLRSKPTGVIAFFGETASRKSTFATGLIDVYLEELINSGATVGRRPHLLTFEDPIENVYGVYSMENESTVGTDATGYLQQTAELLGVDYTPRCIGKDTPSLEAGLLNALRQKPAVVYVGETRTREDWRSVLEFGGTGHLVVTTSHAGTLQESMSHLFKAAEAGTPAQRSFVAGKVLAVIHLRAYVHKHTGEQVVIPSMWRRTPPGTNTLVTDGLGSILPHNLGTSIDTNVSSLGRHWFGQYISDKLGAGRLSDDLLRQLLLDDLQSL